MKVRANAVIDVDIDEGQARMVTYETILKYIGFKKGQYISNGYVCEDFDVYTSHSWTETRQIRIATPLDVACWTVFRAILDGTKNEVC